MGSKYDPFREERRAREVAIMKLWCRRLPYKDIARSLNVTVDMVGLAVERAAARATFEKIVRESIDRLNKKKGYDVFENILQLSIDALTAYLKGLQEQEFRNKHIKNVKDAKMVADIISQLHLMMRIEIGKDPNAMHPALPMTVSSVQRLVSESFESDPVFDAPKTIDISDGTTKVLK